MKKIQQDILNHYISWCSRESVQMAELHQVFLKTRSEELQHLSDLMKLQAGERQASSFIPAKSAALFTTDDLNEFAMGSIVKCFGNAYSIYDGRQCPRIPNRDLMMMSRIVQLKGEKRNFKTPAEITAEYDVPNAPWYLTNETNNHLPIALLMEIGLQPCGFLAAWLETALQLPEVDFYFRNLDGNMTVNQQVNPIGKTISTRAKLLKTFSSGSTIIQEFEFETSCDHNTLARGTTSFGFFPLEALQAQNGLDSGKSVPTWLEENGNIKNIARRTPTMNTDQKLNLLDEISIVPAGGMYGSGYVHGYRTNSPSDWFYACHFKGDPVMPGSLGIETIFQTCREYIQHIEPTATNIQLTPDNEFVWKYRGQVLQHHKGMRIEVHFTPIQPHGNYFVITDNASLWADDVRIYHTKNISIIFQK